MPAAPALAPAATGCPAASSPRAGRALPSSACLILYRWALPREHQPPLHIKTLLTATGRQHTDRFTRKKKAPSGEHSFDLARAEFSVDHRLIRSRHPQTNGLVERFEGRIRERVGQTRLVS